MFKKPLARFSQSPMTGFFRDGYCRVGPEDGGNHAVAGALKLSPLYLILMLFSPSSLFFIQKKICPSPPSTPFLPPESFFFFFFWALNNSHIPFLTHNNQQQRKNIQASSHASSSISLPRAAIICAASVLNQAASGVSAQRDGKKRSMLGKVTMILSCPSE